MGRRGARDSLVDVKRAVSGGVVMMEDARSLLLVIKDFNKERKRDCISPGFGRDVER